MSSGLNSSTTDKYFLRSKEILAAEGINPIVRYQVFARKDLESFRGIDRALEYLLENVDSEKVSIKAIEEGSSYKADTPIMKIEGPVQDLIDLETNYLGILSGENTPVIDFEEMRARARDIREAAGDKPVLYFGARHFDPMIDQKIARICYEEGFNGTSTDGGAKAWDSVGNGTTPHALFLAYAAHFQDEGIEINPTVAGAIGFNRHVDSNVPRIILGCTFNQEISDIVQTARVIPNLVGTRIDTCGENYTERGRDVKLPNLDVDEKYLSGRGVTIASVWGVRQGLDNAGIGHLQIVVSSGFNAEKTKAFMVADEAYQGLHGKPLFDSIGTGSLAKPYMTTSDIVAYKNSRTGEWRPMSKVGRSEIYGSELRNIEGGVLV